MKKVGKIIFSVATIVAIAVSCTKEMEGPSASGSDSKTVFSASFVAPSSNKTTIEDGEGNTKIVKWEAGDEITIYWDGGSSTGYASTAGTSTTFSAVTDEGVAAYCATYPKGIAQSVDLSNKAFSLTISSSQTGSFPAANMAVAYTTAEAKNFQFVNATALVKFNIGSADYSKAVFRGANGENLVGSFDITLGESITLGEASNTSSSVEVALNGAGDYYFSVLPGLSLPNGFSIALYKDDEAVPAAYLAKSLTIERAQIANLGNIDGRIQSDLFVTPSGAGSKNGKSWENAMGTAELRAFIEQPLASDGTQDDGAAYYKASRLDGATFHMAQGDYYIAEGSGCVKVEFSLYPTQVKATFLGGYPGNLTGTDTSSRNADSHPTNFTGNKATGIFTFGNQTNFTFDGVTFCDVKTASDVNLAVYASAGATGDATLTFTDCSFVDNIQTDKGKTSAAVRFGKATATMTSCTFSGNQARNASAVQLEANSNVTIRNSAFTKNSTWNTSGALQNAGGTLTVEDCLFSSNQSGMDSTMYAAGGAFHANGANSLTTFKDCQFIENKSKVGGAVSVQEAKVILEGCTFQRDTAYRNLGIESKSAADKRAGGAIFIAGNSADVTINDCDFLDNRAPYGSGGAIAVTVAKSVVINAGTTFKNNICRYEGGAIYMLKNFTIAGTSADPVLFENNKTTDAGAQVGNGGAIWLNEGTTSTVRYARFVDNCAGVGNDFSNGGGIYMKGVIKFLAENCYFSGNLGRNGGAANLQLGGSSDCKFISCTFEKNYLNGSNANFGSATLGSCNFHGGAVCVGYGTAQFEKCTFNDNISNNGSGAFHINNNASTVKCTDCTFTNNQSPNGNGGAITLEKGKFYATGCTFSGNQAGSKNHGSVMRIDANSTEAEFTSCLFTGNIANNQGGAVFNANGKGLLKINNCVFTGNKAKSRGACFQTNKGHVIFVNNSTFYNNTTSDPGNSWGVVSHGNATLCMNNATVYGNKNTNSSQSSVISLNGDNSMLLSNCTVIESDNLSLIRANTAGHLLTLANNILVNTAAGKNLFELNAGVTVTAVGNATSTSNVTLPEGNLAGLTETTFSGSYDSAAGAYMWNGVLSGFTAATSEQIANTIKSFSRTEEYTGSAAIGTLFYNWLTSLTPNALTVDGRGVTRTGAWWPGAYQNN